MVFVALICFVQKNGFLMEICQEPHWLPYSVWSLLQLAQHLLASTALSSVLRSIHQQWTSIQCYIVNCTFLCFLTSQWLLMSSTKIFWINYGGGGRSGIKSYSGSPPSSVVLYSYGSSRCCWNSVWILIRQFFWFGLCLQTIMLANLLPY